ncbi:uncharacterized protein IUM83_05753 [Phytophthora cinnamomi]|uniref:uncharacterized protein n=1 Tax=Phytophthora cinnamomi TaxID=4785 RepID=UPI00355A41F7|nr:hypothetical protein IUM83_05753 [Phytophthora cinnamomi]
MLGGRGAKKAGRDDGGRGSAARQSRRVQGLEPEEHKDLETVVRDARKARKAARESDAAQASSKVQGSSEANPGLQNPDVPEEHAREGGAQASEGGANAVEPPEVTDLVSESSSSDESVVEVKSEPVCVKEEAKIQDSLVKSGSAPPEPRIPAPSSRAAPRTTPEGNVQDAAEATPESGAPVLDGERTVMYARREVRRWEDAKPGKVTPPRVDYEWPTPKPDANAYFAAAYATGDYLKWRSALTSQDDAWISEFHLARWGVGGAQDLTATQNPLNVMTPRECVAILPTLFFEAGFEFVNLIPEWSTTRASRIPDGMVRSVMKEIQNFLTAELVKWRLVVAGVPFKVNAAPEDQPAPEGPPRLDYHTEDEDGDLLMTDYDADLLGRQFVLKFRVTGLRISRSPRGSSDSEPQSKRTQLGPPWPQVPTTPSAWSTPSLSSLPAYKSSAGTSRQDSNFGTSRASDESTASGAQVSRGSSSSSSMMSLGQRVGALVLVAQNSGGVAVAGDLGFQVTRTFIPPRLVPVDQDDVEMAPSVHSDADVRIPKRDASRIPASSAPVDTGDVSGDERSQHRSSKSEQEWQARMEQEQREFLARERLDALERERLREQRDLEARHQIQELTDRLVQAEIARGEAERRAQGLEVRQAQDATRTQGSAWNSAEAARLDDTYAERLQKREAEADAERARRASEIHATWKEQVSALEKKVQDVEAERDPGLKNTSAFAAAQLRATVVQSTDTSRRAKHEKQEHGATEAKGRGEDSKRSPARRQTSKKKNRHDSDPPSDSDTSSESSDDDSSSGSSDDSSNEAPGVNLTTAATAKGGTTLLTFRPYINSNTLIEFDTKASLTQGTRTRVGALLEYGCERRMVHQDANSGTQVELSGAARDWFNQLPKHTRRDWKELSAAFKKKFCKARSSYSECYFTMETKNSESALDFFYRLNSAAGKAEIDFRKSSKRLEKHIRRFITKLRDTRLKTSLQGQRFRSVADLEYALEQDEDVWSRSDQDAPTSRTRDFRADNIPQGRFRAKRPGRAFVTRGDDSDSEVSEEFEERGHFQDNNADLRISTRDANVNPESTRETRGDDVVSSGNGNTPGVSGAEWTQSVANEVYHVMDNMGWRPPAQVSGANSGYRSQRRDNPNWDKYCEKCGKWGHPENSCWKDMKCDRCLDVGHPTHMCRAQPCGNCGKLHLGKTCEDWKTLEAVKKLAR